MSFRALTPAEVTKLAERFGDYELWSVVTGEVKQWFDNADYVEITYGDEYNDETYDRKVMDLKVYDAGGRPAIININSPKVQAAQSRGYEITHEDLWDIMDEINNQLPEIGGNGEYERTLSFSLDSPPDIPILYIEVKE